VQGCVCDHEGVRVSARSECEGVRVSARSECEEHNQEGGRESSEE
jgi:hypothetical protein